MMKTCMICGLKYQTMAERNYKYCHKCAVAIVTDITQLLLPVLFELSKELLDKLSSAFIQTNNQIMNELDRRDAYFDNMMAQRKKQ